MSRTVKLGTHEIHHPVWRRVLAFVITFTILVSVPVHLILLLLGHEGFEKNTFQFGGMDKIETEWTYEPPWWAVVAGFLILALVVALVVLLVSVIV